MSAGGNDTAPLRDARIRKIPIVVKDYNQIRFASDAIVSSDMIVAVTMQTDKVLAFWCFFIRSYATMLRTLRPLILFTRSFSLHLKLVRESALIFSKAQQN